MAKNAGWPLATCFDAAVTLHGCGTAGLRSGASPADARIRGSGETEIMNEIIAKELLDAALVAPGIRGRAYAPTGGDGRPPAELDAAWTGRGPGAARSTPGAITSGASCWPGSGSSCSSTRTHRCWNSCRWPPTARTSPSAPAS